MHKQQKFLLFSALPFVFMTIIGTAVAYWVLGDAVFEWGKSLWFRWLLAALITSPFGIGGGLLSIIGRDSLSCNETELSQTEREKLWAINIFLIVFLVPVTFLASYYEYSSEKGWLSGAYFLMFLGIMMSSCLITLFVCSSIALIMRCFQSRRVN